MVIFGSLGRRALGQGPEARLNLVRFAVSESPDTASFTATSTTQVTLAVTEAPDVASFTLNKQDFILQLAATEAKDIASFNATSLTTIALAATEAKDTASFATQIVTQLFMAATELPDTASFNVTFTTKVTLGATERPDTASFRLFNAFYYTGDTWIISVRAEAREMIVPQVMDVLQINPKYDGDRVFVPREEQRIRVRQTVARRREYQ